MQDFYKKARALHESHKYDEALALYEQGIDAGDAKCWYGYGIFVKNGHAVKKNEKKGLACLKEHYADILALAEAGDAAAMRIMGLYYYNGFIFDADESVALEWFEKAAENGDGSAQRRAAPPGSLSRGTTGQGHRGVAAADQRW